MTFFAIEVDYATGKLTGARMGDKIAFVDVVLGSDRSSFAGRFISRDGDGTLEGRPDRGELMMLLIVPGKAIYLYAMKKTPVPQVY